MTANSAATAQSSSIITSSAPRNASLCHAKDRTVTVVGVGLGVGWGLFAIAAVVGLFIESKKRKLAEQAASKAPTASEVKTSGFYNSHLNELHNRQMPNEAGSRPLYEIGNSQGIVNTVVEVG